MEQPPASPPAQIPKPLALPSPPAIVPLTATEVAQIAIEMQSLIGAQFQECLQTTSELGLAFYHDGQTLWLWFDLQPLRPIVVRLYGKAPGRKKIARPLSLFIRSRFLGRRLESVRADVARGRVIVFSFHRAREEETTEPIEIEVRLFPHGQNVIARDGSKSVAENKPKDLPPPHSGAGGGASGGASGEADTSQSGGRRWEEIEAQWRAHQASPQKPSGVKASRDDAQFIEKEYKRAIEKKEKALERMRDELKNKTSSVYSDLGMWLKANGTLELPPDAPPAWRELLKTDRSLSWNIEDAFHRSKENARKADGTRLRLRTVEAEVADLRARGPAAFVRGREKEDKAGAQNLLSQAEARGRRFKLADDLEVYVGKSGADNLALLRRAQPFDYWLHLREQPGSHAILRRTRSRNVTDREFQEAGRWVVEQSVGKRIGELKGERFDLLIVECRYVRPIKGDKVGRVNYSNDRVMTLKF